MEKLGLTQIFKSQISNDIDDDAADGKLKTF